MTFQQIYEAISALPLQARGLAAGYATWLR